MSEMGHHFASLDFGDHIVRLVADSAEQLAELMTEAVNRDNQNGIIRVTTHTPVVVENDE